MEGVGEYRGGTKSSGLSHQYLSSPTNQILDIGTLCWRVQTDVRKTRKTNVDILYVPSAHISGEMVLEDRKVGKYGTDRSQSHLFLFI